jgi:hypothetical protein
MILLAVNLFDKRSKVMLDKDFMELLCRKQNNSKRQVRRNIERFPDDFMFELNQLEFDNLRSFTSS